MNFFIEYNTRQIPPPLIYKRLCIYKYIPTHNYGSMCQIRTNSKHASISRELMKTNVYSAQLTRSTMLNFDGSKQTYLSKYAPNNSTAGEWPKFGHKDHILTTSLSAGGRL